MRNPDSDLSLCHSTTTCSLWPAYTRRGARPPQSIFSIPSCLQLVSWGPHDVSDTPQYKGQTRAILPPSCWQIAANSGKAILVSRTIINHAESSPYAPKLLSNNRLDIQPWNNNTCFTFVQVTWWWTWTTCCVQPSPLRNVTCSFWTSRGTSWCRCSNRRPSKAGGRAHATRTGRRSSLWVLFY